MIGRGIFHDPYLFSQTKKLAHLTLEDRLSLLLKHARLFDKTWGKGKNFAILKKFFKIYTLGLPNAGEIRSRLMEANNFSEVEQITLKL
jgi:tRNA-dihydrouridine synthase